MRQVFCVRGGVCERANACFLLARNKFISESSSSSVLQSLQQSFAQIDNFREDSKSKHIKKLLIFHILFFAAFVRKTLLLIDFIDVN